MIHTNIKALDPVVSDEKIFSTFPYISLCKTCDTQGRVIILPKEHSNKYDRSFLDNASYKYQGSVSCGLRQEDHFMFPYIKKIVSMIRKYHNHKPQTTLWHREEEPLNHHETPGRQIKQSNQLSLPH